MRGEGGEENKKSQPKSYFLTAGCKLWGKKFFSFSLSLNMHGSKHTCKACFYLNRLMLTNVCMWVLRLHYSPLLAVLAHAYSSAMARGRVAAGTLTHLKANTTGGAAGRPGSPGGPRSISMVTDEAMSVCDFSH